MSSGSGGGGGGGGGGGSSSAGGGGGTNIRVVVRVRPLLEREAKRGASLSVESPEATSVRVSIPLPEEEGGRCDFRPFAFDYVYEGADTQEDVFKTSGIEALVASSLAGYSSTVVAYGQTGSGKTYTMSGVEEKIVKRGFRSPATDGLLPRCLSYLFEEIGRRQQEGGGDGAVSYSVRASYLEIYNEQVMDLLAPPPQGRRRPNMPVRFGADKGFFVENLLVVGCASTEDLMAVAAEGHRNRHVGSHSLNKDSSRSHSVMTIYLESTDAAGVRRQGKISFVDLAGSENLKQSKSQGAMVKETGQINKSLFVLGKVISALGDIHTGRRPRNHHVPYRDSVLTKLLMDSLGGYGLTLMIACCSPSSEHVDETLRTLSYATRARNIKNTPTVRMDPKERELLELRGEVARLRRENALIRQVAGEADLALPPPLTPGPGTPPVEYGGRRSGGRSRGGGDQGVGGGGGYSQPDSVRHAPYAAYTEAAAAAHARGTGAPASGDAEYDHMVVENMRLKRKVEHLERVFLTQNDDEGLWSGRSRTSRLGTPSDMGAPGTPGGFGQSAQQETALAAAGGVPPPLLRHGSMGSTGRTGSPAALTSNIAGYSPLQQQQPGGDDPEGLRSELRAARQRNAELQQRVHALERGAGVQSVPGRDPLAFTPNGSARKEAQDSFCMRAANRALERQIEAFKLREEQAAGAERDVLRYLQEAGHAEYAAEAGKRLAEARESVDPLDRSVSRAGAGSRSPSRAGGRALRPARSPSASTTRSAAASPPSEAPASTAPVAGRRKSGAAAASASYLHPADAGATGAEPRRAQPVSPPRQRKGADGSRVQVHANAAALLFS